MVTPFYIKYIDQQKAEIIKIIDKGFESGYIIKNDSKSMQPSGKPGKLYGIVKAHREFLSAYVNHHAKPLVKQMKPYIEDTSDILRMFG